MKMTFNSKIMLVLYLQYQGASFHCAKSGEENESISACPATGNQTVNLNAGLISSSCIC